MTSKSVYGQFCPLAMAAEFLCKRWTVLVLRELLLGSESFNDISRGVARMSRTLLSQRLKELEQRGLVVKSTKPNQRETCYKLTKAGQSLSSVVFGMADWSQEWLHIEPSLKDIDADHLFWSLRRSAIAHPELPKSFIVHIYLPDQQPDNQNAWLVFQDGEVELCIIDHDFLVDVQLETSAATLTKIYMGWSQLSQEIEFGNLILHGSKHHQALTEKWMGYSRLAKIKKQPAHLRVS